MSKVEIEKHGRVVRVHPRIADVLVNRGGYLRRDMVAASLASRRAAKPEPDAEAAPKRRGRKPKQKPEAKTETSE